MDRSHQLDNLQPATPAFVIDVPLLEKFTDRFFQAMKTYWPNSILGYSFKTNSLPWLVAFMRDRGAWAEVVSDAEYELALALGYTPDRVVLNGPYKTRDRLRSALLGGSIINLDAKRDLEWTIELAREMPDREFGVGLRVNWDLEIRCPGESTFGEQNSRFGFSPENGELDQAITDLEAAGVRIAGLHVHRNSRTQSLNVYQAAATVAAEIITSRDLDLDWIDIGGGFFGSEDGNPTFEDYMRVISETLEPVVDIERTCLITEPGGALVAVPFEFHASVVDVKKIEGETLVLTNASRTNIDPLFRKDGSYDLTIDAQSTDLVSKQVLTGFTLVEGDRLVTLKDQPVLQVDDRVVFYKVGAYTLALQPLFIEYLPAVYARTEDELTLVRRQWGAAEYLQGSQWAKAEGTVQTDARLRRPVNGPRQAMATPTP
ncbi:type III PLP-dependent enzyme domain-containing protein [Yaniella halotolerans]|uniref:diaminopimelate decarboxylase n=1 Tax=Yaniella halotolerans TaxID=225453 RepID=UPI0003B4FEBA|nr:diaminopimelate decarboxylase [Yaniella halotolerans]